MRQRRLKLFTLALGAFSMAVSVAQASGILIIHGSSDQSVEIDTIRRITFGNGNLILKASGSEKEFLLSDITKITFGDYMPSDIPQPADDNLDIVVYAPSRDEVAVKTPLKVLSVSMYDSNGRLMLSTAETRVNTGALPQGVYLLQIGTSQGCFAKKYIKN